MKQFCLKIFLTIIIFLTGYFYSDFIYGQNNEGREGSRWESSLSPYESSAREQSNSFGKSNDGVDSGTKKEGKDTKNIEDSTGSNHYVLMVLCWCFLFYLILFNPKKEEKR